MDLIHLLMKDSLVIILSLIYLFVILGLVFLIDYLSDNGIKKWIHTGNSIDGLIFTMIIFFVPFFLTIITLMIVDEKYKETSLPDIKETYHYKN